ncbi:hypothetical protein [Acidithiobacillus montserratensis]|uniref:hypothetical protein n=1 Tax=Acidithiobacillus montserratensis TaxID=2729135 RepID=UPI003C6F78BA
MSALVSASQENDEISASLLEIHPLTRAAVDSQLGYAFANRLYITGISDSQPRNSGLNSRPRLDVAQGVEPMNEGISFPNFDHRPTVVAWLHLVNRARLLPVIRHIRPKLAYRPCGTLFNILGCAGFSSILMARPVASNATTP